MSEVNSKEKISYKVSFKGFDGPLDLLLKLIEDEEMDITQVSLAKVADQYLDYMNQIENLSLRDMAEFLDVAARLILIKSRALLPELEMSDEEELSAEELQRRLLEYKKFREAGKNFKDILKARPFCFDRLIYFEEERVFSPPKGLTGIALKNIFSSVLGEIPKIEDLEEEVVTEVVSLEEKIEHIRSTLQRKLKTVFSKLTDSKSKIEIIVIFLALLELVKQRIISVKQDETFGDITIEHKGNL